MSVTEYTSKDIMVGTKENPMTIVKPHRWHGIGKQVISGSARVWEVWIRKDDAFVFVGYYTGASRNAAYENYLSSDNED